MKVNQQVFSLIPKINEIGVEELMRRINDDGLIKE